MAAFESAQKYVWLRALLSRIRHNEVLNDPTPILCNNNAAINLSKDPTLHSQVKHNNIKYHFLYKWIQSNEICICYINTKHNITDLFIHEGSGGSFIHLFLLIAQSPTHAMILYKEYSFWWEGVLGLEIYNEVNVKAPSTLYIIVLIVFFSTSLIWLIVPEPLILPLIYKHTLYITLSQLYNWTKDKLSLTCIQTHIN